ncbi:MAG TPA: hypothetical protein VGG82_12150 [Casimicrobiaceae bacterium]|jgi:hypothetical protein
MKLFLISRRTNLLMILSALAVSTFVAGGAAAASPKVDESELLASGFKVLVATTSVQKEWVQHLPRGQIRPMQRTGKKFFIYPDAANNQIYIGGPKEYEAYHQLHPDSKLAAREAAKQGSAYRQKQDDVMQKATARDLTDPFLGADWVDLVR